MILATARERVGLLRAGFFGIDIEKLYLELNFFEIVNVNWQAMV